MSERKSTRMGEMPVKKLLLTLSVPIMLSMLIQALYNIVDSIFVAKISENALTAVSLAFPVQQLMIALSVGTGVGLNALLSKRLGQKRLEEANQVAMNGMFLGVFSAILFAILGLCFSRIFITGFTQDAEILQMGTQYLMIVTIFSLGQFMTIAAERIMQSTGNTIYNMIVQSVGAVINIVLDPVFIFTFKMGVAGAAIATVIAQMASMCLGLYINHRYNKDVTMKWRTFKPDWKIIKGIYKVGLPAIIMQALSSFMVVGINKILMIFSGTAVAVFGVYFKLQSFVFMPVFGLNNGLIPIIGFNYGARKPERILGAVRFALILGIGYMVLGTLAFTLLPDRLLSLFAATPEMYKIGIPALMTISFSFVFACVCIVLSSVMQALGDGFSAMALAFLRQMVLLLPIAFFLAQFFALEALWWAFPIAELLSAVVCVLLYRRCYKKRILPMY